jgi:hypothetical protein
MTNGPTIEFDKLRLFIRDAQNRPRSQCWYFSSYNNSIVIGPEPTGGTLKLSFHASDGQSHDGRNSQWGLITDYREEEERLFGKQTVLQPIRWIRPETPSVGAAHVASILFPTDFLDGTIKPFKPLNKQDQKRIALPLAPSGHAIEVGVFFSFEDPLTIIVRSDAGDTCIGYRSLPGGEYVAFAAREVPFNPASILPASDLGRAFQALSGAPKVSEAIDNCSAILLHDNPADGEAAFLVEINGATIKRN